MQILRIVTIVGLLASCYYFYQKEEGQEREADKFAPSDYFFQQRSYPLGTIDQNAYVKALEFRKTAKSISKSRSNQAWEFVGPLNVGGRVTDIEMFEDDISTIYVGTASGGVFKSIDKGESWEPIFDEALSLSIGDMAISKGEEKVIYVGTGEANAGGGSLAYDGVGVYKSFDQGVTWEHKGLINVGSIGKVVVHPENADIVFVAAMGHLFKNNEERGVYKSIDGGDTWEQVLFLSDSTGAIDLVMHPENPDLIYAAMWERKREAANRQYGGITSGIYQSKDGGQSWEELKMGLPTHASQKGRIGLAIAPSNPATLYAIYARTDGWLDGIYKSTNSGTSWNRVGEVGSVPFMWWFGKIMVDPFDEDRVFVPALDLFRSVDGGNNFTNVSDGMHVDQHALYIHPQNTSLVIAGNDGGVYISENGGTRWTKKNTLPITQFYTCEIDFQTPTNFYGGTQDNGTIRTLSGSVDDWEFIFGGDGFRVLVDPTDSRFVYAESQRGNLGRSVDGGNSFIGALNGIDIGNRRRNWNTPFVFDPNNTAILYMGTERIYKTENRAASWRAISPDLSNGDVGGNIAFFGTVTTIDVSRVNSNIIYAGTDDGNVWNSIDGGENWNKVSEELPNRWVTAVVASPIDENTAYVVYSGYRFGESIGHIYRTENQGNHWEDISGNLPDIPLNDLIVLPNQASELYLASDIGVFRSENNGATWELFVQDLPQVPIIDLDYHAPTQTLVAATYGRGMYQSKLSLSTSFEESIVSINNIKLYPNPTTAFLNIELKLKRSAKISINLIDRVGRKRLEGINNELENGTHHLKLHIQDLESGIYFCEFSDGHTRHLESVVLFKN
jgi:photosystem II stability/assembly factor-like uncharacterized protein